MAAVAFSTCPLCEATCGLRLTIEDANVLTDELVVEPLSGTAVLNGVPVELEPV